MGAADDLPEYTKMKNDPAFMNSAKVADPSSIQPGSFGESPLPPQRLHCNHRGTFTIPGLIGGSCDVHVEVLRCRHLSRSWGCLAGRLQPRVSMQSGLWALIVLNKSDQQNIWLA